MNVRLPFSVGIEHEVVGEVRHHEHDSECYEHDCVHECDDYCEENGCDHDCDEDCYYLVCEEAEEDTEPPEEAYGWDVVEDGSCGYEYVSRVLYSVEGLQWAVNNLFDCYWESDERCGGHIHIGGLVLEEVHALARVWERIEEPLWDFVGVHYDRERYCRLWESFDRPMLPENPAHLKKWWYGSEVECGTSRYDHTRYASLNLNSWFYRETVEFRLFNACGSRGEMLNNVDLCLYICSLARSLAQEDISLDGAVERFNKALQEKVFPWSEPIQLELQAAV